MQTDAEIDLAAEIAGGDGITVVELAHQHRASPSTVFRWVQRGLPRGDGTRVRLAAIKRGRKWVTSTAAVARFFAALPQSEATPPQIRTPARRTRDNALAKQLLS